MILTTTQDIYGQQIKNYLGVTTGAAIVGQFNDREEMSSQQSTSGEKHWFWLVIRSVKSYFSQQRKTLNYRIKRPFSVLLEDAKEFAMEELTLRAEAMGGNAIIAIRVEFHTWNQVLIVSGTVVTI